MKQKSGPIRFRASVVALLAIVVPLLRADETLDLPAASLPVERVIDQLLETEGRALFNVWFFNRDGESLG